MSQSPEEVSELQFNPGITPGVIALNSYLRERGMTMGDITATSYGRSTYGPILAGFALKGIDTDTEERFQSQWKTLTRMREEEPTAYREISRTVMRGLGTGIETDTERRADRVESLRKDLEDTEAAIIIKDILVAYVTSSRAVEEAVPAPLPLPVRARAVRARTRKSA